MAQLDSKWSKVDATNFNTGRYKMHYSYSTTLCNSIRSKVQLKKMVEEALKEAEEEYDEECIVIKFVSAREDLVHHNR